METPIKIKILIAIMQATIISYQKSTKQKYKIENMDHLHGPSAPPQRHTYIRYITAVRRPMSFADQTHKKNVCGSTGKNPHEASDIEARSSA